MTDNLIDYLLDALDTIDRRAQGVTLAATIPGLVPEYRDRLTGRASGLREAADVVRCALEQGPAPQALESAVAGPLDSRRGQVLRVHRVSNQLKR